MLPLKQVTNIMHQYQFRFSGPNQNLQTLLADFAPE
jgi:hypothetical protein